MSFETLTKILNNAGIQRFGVVAIEKPVSIAFYQNWLAEGLHGSMGYMEQHAPLKQEPQKFWKPAQTAIVVARNYLPHPHPLSDFPLKAARISTYARGADYHSWMESELQAVITELRSEFPGAEFLASVDSKPVLERDLAYRAGLGWYGKNTCLIDRSEGSFFFIGEILTSLKLEPFGEISHDFCGKCQRCMDACPTGAFVEPRKLDARKCISYWTIESRDVAPEPIRSQIGDWLFGCDICQTVCPWNQKNLGPEIKNFESGEREGEVGLSSDAHQSRLAEELRWILTSSNKSLARSLRATPLSRAAGNKLKRNALIVIGNQKIMELAPEVRSYLSHDKLGDLAAWTLQCLECPLTEANGSEF